MTKVSRHGAGGIGVGQHAAAVGEQGRGELVVRRGKPIRVTCDDRRDHLSVLHVPNRSWILQSV